MSAHPFIFVSVVLAGCALASVFVAAWQIAADLPNEPEPDDEDDF